MDKKIILASSSPRRAELLSNIKVSFEVVPSIIDESLFKTNDPIECVRELSKRKALDVALRSHHKGYVIGADTVVFLNQIFGKPKDEEDAIQMLMKLSGRWHSVITGVTVIHMGLNTIVSEVEKTRVKMIPYTIERAKHYVKTGEPMDKAGAYGIQGMGSLLVEKLDGCYFNVVGLPLMRLSKIFETLGDHLF